MANISGDHLFDFTGGEGGGGASNLNDLNDVNAGSPSDGDSLVYDLNTNKWIPLPVTGGSGATSHSALTGLTADDHTHYILNAPAELYRNRIQATDASAVALTLKGLAGQTAYTLRVENRIGQLKGGFDEAQKFHADDADLGNVSATYVEATDIDAVSGIFDDASVVSDLDVGGNITVTGTVDGRDVAADGTAQDAHIASGTVHFLEGDIDHANILNIGDNSHADIDNHIDDGTLHFTENSISHANIQDLTTGHPHTQYVLSSTNANLSSLVDNIETSTVDLSSYISANEAAWNLDTDTNNHNDLLNKGSNSHAQIDLHLADTGIHFTKASIDHGGIGGLGDDDHTQYVLADGTRSMDELDVNGSGTLDGPVGIGETSPTQQLEVKSTSNSVAKLTSTNNDGTAGPILDLNRDAAAANTNDIVGKVAFTGNDNSLNPAEYGSITGKITNAFTPTGELNIQSDSIKLTGPVVPTSTVDGRDIAADGTALDNHIASGSVHFEIGDVDLSALGDTNITGTPTTGHILKWTGTVWEAAAETGGGGGGVTDHGALTGLSDNDHPQYVLSATNADLSSLVTSIETSTVDLSTYISDNEAAWNTDTNTSSLSALDDVTIADIAEHQVIAWDGTKWVNEYQDVQYIRVFNDTGSTITAGQAVYITGNHNDNVVTIGLARSDSDTTMPCIGVMDASLPTANEGLVVAFGRAHGMNTSTFTAGDTVYVDPTTAGAITNVRPTGTNLVQNVGIVMKAAASGAIKVTGVGRSNDIPNAATSTTSTDADFIYIDDGGVFKKISPANISPAIDHGSISGLTDDDHTQYTLADGTRSMDTLDVTGNAEVGGNFGINTASAPTAPLQIEGAGTDDAVYIEATDDSEDAGPVITLNRKTDSIAASAADYLGQLKFKGENDAGGEKVYAKITAKIDDPTSGSEDGIIEFMNRFGGAEQIALRLKEDSFRTLNGVELHVDGNTGLGNNNPSEKLDVTGNIKLSGDIQVGGTVDGRDVAADGTTLDDHVASGSVHFTEASIHHGSVSGLGDDDHPQYVLADGTRSMTNLNVGGNITVLGTVDGVDVNGLKGDHNTLQSDYDNHEASSTVHFEKSDINITDLADVDTTSTTATEGDSLVWTGTEWSPSAITGGGASELSDLSDVRTTSPTDGHVLQKNGSNFINQVFKQQFFYNDSNDVGGQQIGTASSPWNSTFNWETIATWRIAELATDDYTTWTHDSSSVTIPEAGLYEVWVRVFIDHGGSGLKSLAVRIRMDSGGTESDPFPNQQEDNAAAGDGGGITTFGIKNFASGDKIFVEWRAEDSLMEIPNEGMTILVKRIG